MISDLFSHLVFLSCGHHDPDVLNPNVCENLGKNLVNNFHCSSDSMRKNVCKKLDRNYKLSSKITFIEILNKSLASQKTSELVPLS